MNKLISDTFPKAIDLGFCPVSQYTTQTFCLENHTNKPVSFNFEKCVFKIDPIEDIIQPYTKFPINISYCPQEATVIIATTNLLVENEPFKTIKLSAIGKYPFLTLSSNKIEFERLLIGKKVTNELTIKNQAQVPARFQIQKADDDNYKDNAFSIDATSGDIPPKSSFLIKVSYTPTIVGLISCAHFNIVCSGGNTLQFECKGEAMGFDVKLSTDSINFGEIKLGTTTSRMVVLHNEMDLQATFQFHNDRRNVFGVSQTSGVINPKSTVRIMVMFNPTNTMNYYERLFCVIRNHQLLYIDLMGTCYDLLIRPKPILQKHIDIFRKKVIEGKLDKEDFVQIKQVLTNDDVAKSKERMLINTINSQTSKLPLANPQADAGLTDKIDQIIMQEQKPDIPNQVVLHKEMMQDLGDEKRLIIINREMLDFGYTEALTLSQGLDFEVFNGLNYKINLNWINIARPDNTGENLPIFNIYPLSAVIKPKSWQRFTVTFRPLKTCSYFFQYLQYFVSRYDPKHSDNILKKDKANRKAQDLQALTSQVTLNQSIILEDEIQPPISGFLSCVGHSFSIHLQPFIPIIDIAPSNNIYFKPCTTGESVYATILLINKTDTHTYFKFSPDQQKVFKVYPMCGLIDGKALQIVTFEFSPTESKVFYSTVACSLNHNLTNMLTFKLYGFCCQPKLELNNNGEIYFPPSFIGVASKQTFRIQNISRISIEYNIDVPEKYEHELSFKPHTKILKPNEAHFLLCSFIPYKKKNYKISVPVKVRDVIDPAQNLIGYYYPGSGKNLIERDRQEADYKIQVFGVGGDGSIGIEPKILDFEIVKVDFTRKREFTLENFSNVAFYVEINITPSDEKLKHDYDMKKSLAKAYKLDFKEGLIPGNSKITVGITFQPFELCEHDLILECIAREKNPNQHTSKHDRLFVQKCSLNIKAKGSYPQLKFVDIRNDSLSVSTLWENFSISNINDQLAKNLTEDEKKYNNMDTLPYEEAQAIQKQLNFFEWNFGSLPNKKPIKPRKIVITIQNIGGTDLEWKFKWPNDSQIEMEPWADPVEPSYEEALEQAMLERKIFDIQPRYGKLENGECAHIVLLYSPSYDEKAAPAPSDKKQPGGKNINEEHYLKVVMQIMNGKPIVLKLKGMTLAPMQGLLAIRKTEYTLPAAPIGSLVPVTFPIEIHNVGTGKITYKVDQSGFLIQKEDDKGHKSILENQIFSVKNHDGMLNPNDKAFLYCQFNPLEAKEYQFKVPIIVSDFVRVIQEINLNIKGRGYNNKPPKQQLSKEIIISQRSSVSTIGSQVFFSIEEIDFGELDSQKPEHRLILLYNASKDKRLRYDFHHKTGLVCDDELILDPASGELEPNSFVQIKITLTANPRPSIYEGEIECTIFWQPEKKTKKFDGLTSNRYDNDDKETLFLRIKKKSKFESEKKKWIPLEDITQTDNKNDKHLFEIILERIIGDVINDPITEEMLVKMSKLPVQLYASFNEESPANIHNISTGLEDRVIKPNADCKDYRNMFFLDEFTDMVDMIMEGTFFNITQQTTLKEVDLLKPSKTYLQPK